MRGSWSIVAFTLLGFATAAPADQWTRFRGLSGAGAGEAPTIGVPWTDADYNWKVELPGAGHGSPVVWGDRVYLTCGDPQTARRTILCLGAADGRTVWRRDDPSRTYRHHRDNSFATATPAVDAGGVVVTWTTPEEVVLLALDLDGRPRWRRDLGPFVGPHGSGTSPILVGNLVVLANEQEDLKLLAKILGREDPEGAVGRSFLIGVDRNTGETRWQVPRRSALAAYSTPCLRRRDDGRDELIFTSTGHGITAIDPATGKVNWELDDVFTDRCVGSPVAAAGLVIATYGHGTRGERCVAVRPDSTDGQPPALVYDVTRSVPLVPTPLVCDGRLLLWCDDGVVAWRDLTTGEEIWRRRVGGEFYGSPVRVGDRLFCIAKNGDVVVLAASDRFELLARAPLGEPSFATPAVSGGVVYLRTRSHLFSLGGGS
ncbi:MAG: PQQ-binding-like beta-propeller repeat protein [Pirellulales bacterium]|nr:PQQ-binding-like beta-propeller repeat protein [Pirellulales bacterium]